MDFLTRFKNNLKSDTELDCFHQCLLPHSGVMYRSAYRLCMNKQDAEDLVQETFFFAIKNFHQLKDRTKSKYWLFSILRN
ncbi:MAG: hypothetical protein GWM98_20160, partial [Nitrospinaceae bacterium]|nr:RNA polymerase sigma factor [Nitrospinaceae bacterium]NIR56367.1 RNA polymerase sigma factor [Nitrospinaceae bacterium]NIS86829.1 RNA polymerase sigma factor [Nitrospinaceae bacterium]NIT83665.1 RNA polymerase sigma factor [Nitrospinaceae bacterium]NIU45863.1 RNA polymerase sigma factor [Nitrospinaceae bacterium]